MKIFGPPEATRQPVMCVCSPVSQSYPGTHKTKCCQKLKGVDSPPLLNSPEIPSASSSGVPVQERHRPVRGDPEEHHKNGQKAGTPLL